MSRGFWMGTGTGVLVVAVAAFLMRSGSGRADPGKRSLPEAQASQDLADRLARLEEGLGKAQALEGDIAKARRGIEEAASQAQALEQTLKERRAEKASLQPSARTTEEEQERRWAQETEERRAASEARHKKDIALLSWPALCDALGIENPTQREVLARLMTESVERTEGILGKGEAKELSREEVLAALERNRADTDARARGLLSAEQFRSFLDHLSHARAITSDQARMGHFNGGTTLFGPSKEPGRSGPCLGRLPRN